MHRFFSEQAIGDIGQEITLSKEESTHASRVLRMREGDIAQVLDGVRICEAELTEVGDKATRVRVLSLLPSPEPPVRATLIQGLPKADKLELITQKATELGVWDIWPVYMSRCVAKPDGGRKDERLKRIALEAAKQSGRAHAPEILPSQSFAEALKTAETLSSAEKTLVLVAWEEERTLPLSRAVSRYIAANGQPERVILVIGPEGGITREEWDALKQISAVSVMLGPRILRTETAGLCALAVLWGTLGEM